MWRRVLGNIVLSLLGGCVLAAPAVREAPNNTSVPVNQLVVAGNACGPAALLNAFRCGSTDWQRASQELAGATDKECLLKIIREIGMRPSRHLPGHARWRRRGVSVADLRDMANEMTVGHYLPQISEEVFFPQPRETQEQLFRRVYQRLATSLTKGLPPIVSLRRHALRQPPGEAAQWVVIAAHCVTLTAMPRTLDKNVRAFSVSYIDPWGGRRCNGSIGIPGSLVFAAPGAEVGCLTADFPQSEVGSKEVRGGEQTVLAVAAAIGRW